MPVKLELEVLAWLAAPFALSKPSAFKTFSFEPGQGTRRGKPTCS